MKERLKGFILGGILIGGLSGIVTYLVMHGKVEQLEQRYHPNQKVEFLDKGVVGWTNPQKQRIYLKNDLDGDYWTETYFIEHPFSKDKFRIVIESYGKDNLPREY